MKCTQRVNPFGSEPPNKACRKSGLPGEKMRLIRSIMGMLALLLILAACSSNYLYLVKQPDADISREIQWQCLAGANYQITAGAPPISEAARAQLAGNDVRYFLWWGSLSGPRPIIDRGGHPSETQSLFFTFDPYKIDMAERYVLCLLNHGFMWPDDRPATNNHLESETE